MKRLSKEDFQRKTSKSNNMIKLNNRVIQKKIESHCIIENKYCKKYYNTKIKPILLKMINTDGKENKNLLASYIQ